MFEGVTPTANADMTVALTLAKSLAAAFDTGTVFNEALTLALTQQLVPTVTAIFEAAAAFANAQGISDGNTAVMEAVQNLGITQGLDLSSVATLSANVTFALENGVTLTGEIGVATIEAALALAAELGVVSDTSGSVFEPTFTAGIVQSVDTVSIANIYAASILGSQLALTTAGGNLLEAAISYAIEHTEVNTVDFDIDGQLLLGINEAMTASVQSDLVGDATFVHQLVIQSAVTAVLNAGLSLSTIQNLVVNGSLVSFTLELPDCRTLVVKAEGRTLSVQSEDRTLTVTKPCT